MSTSEVNLGGAIPPPGLTPLCLSHQRVELGGRIRLWQWHEDAHQQLRCSREHHGHWLQDQASDILMLEFNRQLSLAPYLVQRPPFTKLGAYLVQLRDQSRKPGILGV